MKQVTRILLTVVLVLAVIGSAQGNQRKIVKVYAGDLVEIEGGWKTRIAGIECPGCDKERAKQAREFAEKELKGKRVSFYTWTEDNTADGIVYDEDGIPFATIKYGSKQKDFGEVMLEKGLAKVDPEHLPKDKKYYMELERKTREAVTQSRANVD